MNVVGSIKKLTVEGISYPVAGDANAKIYLSGVENTMIATSGDAVLQQKRQVQRIENLDLTLSPAEAEDFRNYAKRVKPIKIAVTLRNGKIYSGEAVVNFDGYETENGKATMAFFAVTEWHAL
jgi:hypothetical protein